MKKRFGITDKNQAKDFTDFYDLIFRMKISCDKSFHQLFSFPTLCAHIPMQREMPIALKCAVHFYYGDKDWMER